MDVYLLAPLFQTLFSIVLLIIVLKGHFRSSVHRLFALYILGTAFWGVFIFAMRASPDLEHAYFWDKLIIPLAGFSSVVLYHFAVRYTATKIKRLLLPFLYSVCFIFIPLAGADLVFSGMQIKPYGYAPIFGPVVVLWMLFSYIVFFMALALFIRCYRTCYRAELRNRAAYIIVGMLCSLVGSFFDALPLLGLPLYPGLVIGNIAFLTLTTVAIVRYNLLDIRVVLRKGIAYFLVSAFIAVPFIAIHLVSHFYLAEIAAATSAYIVLGIIWVILLPQFWRVVQQMVDRWFYRDRYNYLKALESFSRETYSLTDSDKIGSNTVNLFAGALRVSNVSLLQPLSPKGDFINAFSSNVNIPTSDVLFKRQSLLVKWLERSNRMLPHDEIELIPQLQGISFKEKEALRRLDAKLIVPLTTLTTRTPRLSGVLILGPKLSEEPYTVEDKQLIYTLSSQIAVKLENAQLYNTTQQEVAERKQAEEREKQLQEELNRTSRLAAVGELAAGVAHEINNPLTGILGFSERLMRKSTGEKISRDLERIHSEAVRAAKVVKNLRTFARRREPSKEYSNVNNIVRQALELRAYELKTGNIEVVTDLTTSFPKAMVDFYQIEEVFLNIILNAEQAMIEANGGGKLSIKTQKLKHYIRISFTDDGPGLPADQLDKVFDPFFTTRGEKGGTGLGLSVCHGIVTGHGGRIYAKSKEGKGTTFFVELPIARSL